MNFLPEHADRLAQERVNQSAFQTMAGITLSPKFMSHLDKVWQYRAIRDKANNLRDFDHLTAKVAAEEQAACEAFIKADDAYEHQAVSRR